MTIKCTNANAGTFNHECGKPAKWIGFQPSALYSEGYPQKFCNECKDHGSEAKTVKSWMHL